jgi:transcriptional regulator GlxA family with amidase domain
MMDFSGAYAVFAAAHQIMTRTGMEGYAQVIASLSGGFVSTSEGLRVHTQILGSLPAVPPNTTVFIDGGSSQADSQQADETRRWLQSNERNVCHVALVGPGAKLPSGTDFDIDLSLHTISETSLGVADASRLFERRGRVWACSGGVSGIDLALAIIQADFGPLVAVEIGRHLALFTLRPACMPRHSTMLNVQQSDDSLTRFHLWLLDNLHRNELDVAKMAEQACMSSRNFGRIYKVKTGLTPAKALEYFRLEAACKLLVDSSFNIDRIASRCGFGDEERMRITFHRNIGVTPSEYRKMRCQSPRS